MIYDRLVVVTENNTNPMIQATIFLHNGTFFLDTYRNFSVLFTGNTNLAYPNIYPTYLNFSGQISTIEIAAFLESNDNVLTGRYLADSYPGPSGNLTLATVGGRGLIHIPGGSNLYDFNLPIANYDLNEADTKSRIDKILGRTK